MVKIQQAYNSGKYPTKINGKRVPAYEVWRHMVSRCGYTNQVCEENYTDVAVSDSWLDYSNFYEDVVNMVGYNIKGFVLDKDILSVGSKAYSKETCCFVPAEINVALTNSKSTRGKFFVGVDFHQKTKKFRARHKKHLGLFNTEVEAFQVYKQDKETYLKSLAEK